LHECEQLAMARDEVFSLAQWAELSASTYGLRVKNDTVSICSQWRTFRV
jgi:hypothetical protein